MTRGSSPNGTPPLNGGDGIPENDITRLRTVKSCNRTTVVIGRDKAKKMSERKEDRTKKVSADGKLGNVVLGTKTRKYRTKIKI